MTVKPRLLDLFCGAGGCAKGYQRAGFCVVGVDTKPQPHYCGDEFYQKDALEALAVLGAHVDVVHASPPCQGYAGVTDWRGSRSTHPKLISQVREQLQLWEGRWHKPWVIENVREAPLRADFILCGTMFGLPIRRHRVFEVNWKPLELTPPCQHQGSDLPFMHKGERAYADAMGCIWMNKTEGRQAIPPAYTFFIGKQLMRVLEKQRHDPLPPQDAKQAHTDEQ